MTQRRSLSLFWNANSDIANKAHCDSWEFQDSENDDVEKSFMFGQHLLTAQRFQIILRK